MTNWKERLLGYKSQAERERREAEEEARQREEQKARQQAEAERSRREAQEALNREALDCFKRLGVEEKLRFVREHLWKVGSAGKIQFVPKDQPGDPHIYGYHEPRYVLTYSYPKAQEIGEWSGGNSSTSEYGYEPDTWYGTGRYRIGTGRTWLVIEYRTYSWSKLGSGSKQPEPEHARHIRVDGWPRLSREAKVEVELHEGDPEAWLTDILGEAFREQVKAGTTPLELAGEGRQSIRVRVPWSERLFSRY